VWLRVMKWHKCEMCVWGKDPSLCRARGGSDIALLVVELWYGTFVPGSWLLGGGFGRWRVLCASGFPSDQK
jgi:hypothetical protein